MSKNKKNKIELFYLVDDKGSKRFQPIKGILIKPKKTLKNNIKILRKLAYEKFVQTFPLINTNRIKNIIIF